MHDSIPFHVWLTVGLIGGSVLLCLFLGVSGACWKLRAAALPPVPLFPGSKFPGFIVQFYTVFFGITFSMAAAIGCIQNPGATAEQETDLLNLVLNAALQIAMYLPLVIAYMIQPRRDYPAASFLRKTLWLILGLMAVTIPAQILETLGLNQWLIDATGCPPLQDVVTTISHGDLSIKIAMVVMAVVIAPITEECYFRGCVYNVLKQYSGRALSCVASALLFSVVHASLAQVIPLFIFGVVQCIVYEKARSLWLPIVLHMLFNGLSCCVILLS